MIKIELEAESLNELLSKVMTTLGITPGVPAVAPAPVTLTPVEPVKEDVFAKPPADVIPLDPTKRRVGRPSKVKATEPESLPIPDMGEAPPHAEPASVPAVPEAAGTVMVAALNAYVGRKDGGLLKAKDILAKYGYTRVKEVKPEHYAAITEACK